MSSSNNGVGMTVLTYGPPERPSSITFEPGNRLVVWDLVGSNRLSGILEQLTRMFEHPEFDRNHGILLDTSDAIFEEVRIHHMVAVADATRSHRGGRRAIVLRNPTLRKLADFFMLVRGDDGKVRFFKAREDTLDWLRQDATGTAEREDHHS